MAQKFGGAIGGAAVLWLLDSCGYIARSSDAAAAMVDQPQAAISCLWMLMTFIPAAVALISICVVWFYPLTTEKVDDIVARLKVQRGMKSADNPQQDEATDFANV